MKRAIHIIMLLSLALGLSINTGFAQSSGRDPSAFEAPEMPPAIGVTKTANPTQVVEPGGDVTFTVVVTNLSGPNNPVTITSLVDDIHGDLNGQGTCSVPQVILPGASYTCSFTAAVMGAAGDSETDTVTASGTDKNGIPVTASDDATVTIIAAPVEPVIQVDKTANPTQVVEPGGDVTFTVVVTNLSGAENAVTITSLVDDIHGDLNGQGTCSVPQVIQPGASYTCSFTAAVMGAAGDSETDTVTASGTDSHERPVSDSDDATVEIVTSLYKVYLPSVEKVIKDILLVPMSLGYEDLQFDRPDMDYDYNDWVTNVDTQLTTDESQNLYRISFEIQPLARGGVRTHRFHIVIPANTFASDGVATWIYRDQNGNIVDTTQTSFDASQSNDFVVIPCTCEAFPTAGVKVNAVEGTPYVPTQRTAELSIEFYTPGPFDLNYVNEDHISEPHGTGLFFDPYLEVLDNNLYIHQGDARLLSVPDLNWMWPEERVRIDKVYTDITGTPPNFVFPNGWWKDHNTCVYGDGIPCPSSFFSELPGPG